MLLPWWRLLLPQTPVCPLHTPSQIQRIKYSRLFNNDLAYVKGTINDPTTFPTPNRAHGSIHWTFERSLSAALVPVTAATAIASPNPLLDGLLGVTLIMHSHLVSFVER